MRALPLAIISAITFSIPVTRAFYLPGAAPHNYAEGEQVELFVNALTPTVLTNKDNAKLVRKFVNSLEAIIMEMFRNLLSIVCIQRVPISSTHYSIHINFRRLLPSEISIL